MPIGGIVEERAGPSAIVLDSSGIYFLRTLCLLVVIIKRALLVA